MTGEEMALLDRLFEADVAAARERPYRNAAVIALTAAAHAYAAGKHDSEARRWFGCALEPLDPHGDPVHREQAEARLRAVQL